MNKGYLLLFLVLGLGLLVGSLWNHVPVIKETAHYLLDPSAGKLLSWNINVGMIVIVGVITLFITVVQKYTLDIETLKRLKAEQKDIQRQMKEFKDHPEKMLEFQKRQLPLTMEILEVSMSSTLYSAIPIILFFRWFSDYFINHPVKIFGFMSWFWAYIIISIVFSSIFRKIFKLP
jgi:uncharacterized membrane protein (DUF106 family)